MYYLLKWNGLIKKNINEKKKLNFSPSWSK